MRFRDIEGAKRRWVDACQNDDLGLWWVADDVRELMPGATEEDIRREVLAALRPLLLSDAIRAATPLPDGEFALWEGSTDEQLSRIDIEWRRLGRQPTLGDVVWFVGPRRWRH